MNPVVTEFIKLAAKLIAAEVANHLGEIRKPGEAAAEAAGAPVGSASDKFTPDVTTERPEADWRADCLAIINVLAPTHGRQLRALLAKFDGAKKLSEIKAADLPAVLAELAGLQNAS